MTRINSGIHPRFLTAKHLIAEHREIKRIPNVVKSGKFNMDNQPLNFTLGTGHVKYFYNRQKYLYRRYKLIYQECINRGYDVQDYSNCWDDLKNTIYFNDWTETIESHILIKERIRERLGVDDWEVEINLI